MLFDGIFWLATVVFKMLKDDIFLLTEQEIGL